MSRSYLKPLNQKELDRLCKFSQVNREKVEEFNQLLESHDITKDESNDLIQSFSKKNKLRVCTMAALSQLCQISNSKRIKE